MLKLKADPTFKAKVGIPIAGQETPVEIECEFKHMSRADLVAFFESAQREASRWRVLVGRMTGKKPQTDAERLGQILVGWSGVDEPCSHEAIERMCEVYPLAPSSIVEAWARGLAEARLGN